MLERLHYGETDKQTNKQANKAFFRVHDLRSHCFFFFSPSVSARSNEALVSAGVRMVLDLRVPLHYSFTLAGWSKQGQGAV